MEILSHKCKKRDPGQTVLASLRPAWPAAGDRFHLRACNFCSTWFLCLVIRPKAVSYGFSRLLLFPPARRESLDFVIPCSSSSPRRPLQPRTIASSQTLWGPPHPITGENSRLHLRQCGKKYVSLNARKNVRKYYNIIQYENAS